MSTTTSHPLSRVLPNRPLGLSALARRDARHRLEAEQPDREGSGRGHLDQRVEPGAQRHAGKRAGVDDVSLTPAARAGRGK